MGKNTIHEVQFPMLRGWENTEGEPLIDITGGAKMEMYGIKKQISLMIKAE